MKYKNKTSILIILLLLIISFGTIAYLDNRIEYKLFLSVITIFSLILYMFAIFEYYTIDESKLVHANKLGFQNKEVNWKDIKSIYLYPAKYFRAIRVRYGLLNENEIVINTGVRDYKEIIKIILEKTKNNPNISIDQRVDDLIK